VPLGACLDGVRRGERHAAEHLVGHCAAVALFRPAVERAHETYATRPVAATLAGLGALVPAVGVFVVFARAAHPGVKLLTGACSAGGQCSRSSSSFPFSGGSRCSP